MLKPSESEFRLAFLVDTFPRRTESFLLREIDETVRHWPSVRVYCFRESPEDWALVDPDLRLGNLSVRSLRRTLGGGVFLHARSLVRSPGRHGRVFRAALSSCPASSLRAFAHFDRAVILADRLRADGVTHLHAHFLSDPGLVACLATRLFSIPYSLSAHAADVWSVPVCQEVIRSAVCCVACSRGAAEYLARQCPGARIETIHHGLSRSYLERSLPRSHSAADDPSELRILSAGRLVNKKGFDLLIGACARLSGDGVPFRCRIFGDGPLRPVLANEIERAGLSSLVALRAFVSHEELRREFAEADLFALPCRIDESTGDRDGIPNLLLEAMAAGTVVVSTDLPTIRELITPDVNGYLAPAGDSAGLAHALRAALTARDQWPGIREAARETLRRRFCLEDNQARFRRLLAEVSAGIPLDGAPRGITAGH